MTLVGNLTPIMGGAAESDLPVSSVKELFRLLAECHPALDPHLGKDVAVAIDGQILQDSLYEPTAPDDSEVFIRPQTAGG